MSRNCASCLFAGLFHRRRLFMSEGGDFFIRTIIATGTSVVLVPADCRACCCLCFVVNIVVSERGNNFLFNKNFVTCRTVFTRG